MNSGLRELKISAEINSMSCGCESLQQLQRENKQTKKVKDYSFILHLRLYFAVKRSQYIMQGKGQLSIL